MFSASFERGNRAVAVEWNAQHGDTVQMTLFLNYLDVFHKVESRTFAYQGKPLPEGDSFLLLDAQQIQLLEELAEPLFNAAIPTEWIERLMRQAQA